MALTANDRSDTTIKVVEKIFVTDGATANMTTTDVRAAVDSIDDDLDALVSTFTQTDNIITNIKNSLPSPFNTTATDAQKNITIAHVLMKRASLI